MAALTPGEKKTVAVLAAALVVVVLVCVGLLTWEFYSIGLNDQATISETIWVLFAHQPGPFLFLAMTLAFWVGVLGGHFFWQSAPTYDEKRLSPEALRRAMKGHDGEKGW